MPNVLVFRPDYEVLTHYTSKYLEAYVVRSATQLGFSVTDLYAEEAGSDRFFQEINRQDLVIFGTHGLENRLYAQNGTVLFSSCSGDESLSGKICFALACKSASKLGYSAVDKGCMCYFGWLQDFVVIIDESYTDPLEDPYAGSFLRPVVNGINAMLSSYIYGRKLNEIAEITYNTVFDSFNQQIAYWRTVESSTASQMLTYLYWDRDNFIPIFREEVYVPTPVYIPPSLRGVLAIGVVAAPLIIKAIS